MNDKLCYGSCPVKVMVTLQECQNDVFKLVALWVDCRFPNVKFNGVYSFCIFCCVCRGGWLSLMGMVYHGAWSRVL